MTADAEANGKVTFTVKELLVEMSRDIKDVSSKLDTKADLATVNVLASQGTDHALRLNTIETENKQKIRLESLWFPIIASGLIGAMLGVTTIIAAFPHGVGIR